VTRKLPDWKQKERDAARRAALRTLRKAEREASRNNVALSQWEGEFLGSVAERVKTYGRAFGDPDKGAPGQALSAMQARKLKEITAKAKGEETRPRRRPAWKTSGKLDDAGEA
jgi:hypothetical protein